VRASGAGLAFAFVVVAAQVDCGTSNGVGMSDGGDPSTLDATNADSATSFDGASAVPADADADADAAAPPSPDSGPDAAVKANCGAGHLTGCYRGMYLSLYTDRVGQIVFGGATEPYKNILGDAAKEAKVLAFIGAHRIESLALYDLGAILADPGLEADLLSFLNRAAAQGVVDVNAIADATKSGWDSIAAYQRQNSRFDGVLTEIEFWNPGGATFQDYTATLQYIRSLGMKARSGAPMRVASYIGWPDAAQIDALAPLVDRLYVHVYVTSPDQAYAYGKQRFQWVASANTQLHTHVDVWPIFSAEGVTWSAGAEHFMGDWLSSHTLDEAESTLLTAWQADPAGPAITGIEYYEAFFLEQYVH
jgi:hypothetical protein